MDEIMNTQELKGAVVIDNCATILLQDGRKAIFKGGEITAENNGTREFWNGYGEEAQSKITLPVVYE